MTRRPYSAYNQKAEELDLRLWHPHFVFMC